MSQYCFKLLADVYLSASSVTLTAGRQTCALKCTGLPKTKHSRVLIFNRLVKIAARSGDKALKLPQRVLAEPGHQRYFGAF